MLEGLHGCNFEGFDESDWWSIISRVDESDECFVVLPIEFDPLPVEARYG